MNMSEIKDNPLLNYSGLPPFSQVKPEHVKSAVETAIERCKKQIIELSEKYKNEATWDNVISPIELSLHHQLLNFQLFSKLSQHWHNRLYHMPILP